MIKLVKANCSTETVHIHRGIEKKGATKSLGSRHKKQLYFLRFSNKGQENWQRCDKSREFKFKSISLIFDKNVNY